MGRAIKFRAWDKKNKKMLCPLSGIIWGKPIIPADYAQGIFDYDLPSNYSFFSDEMVTVDDCELMEYAGLPDKNGIDIYSQDILKVGTEITTVYRTDSGMFMCHYESGKLETFYSDPRQSEYEVIGNTLQNPELWKHI